MEKTQSDTVDLFMRVAQSLESRMDWRHGETEVSQAARETLAGSLAQLPAAAIEHALPYIRAEELPASSVDQLLSQDFLTRYSPEVEKQVLALSWKVSDSRSLHMLAGQLAVAQRPHADKLGPYYDALLANRTLTPMETLMKGGGIIYPTLAQPVLQTDDGSLSLEQLLRQGRPEVFAPATEAMAENYHGMGAVRSEPIIALLKDLLPRLPDPQRLRETFLVGNPDLYTDQEDRDALVKALGEHPGAPEWQALVRAYPDDPDARRTHVAQRLEALRGSRFGEAPTATTPAKPNASRSHFRQLRDKLSAWRHRA